MTKRDAMMKLGTIVSMVTILAGLLVAVCGFLIRDVTPLSWAIVAFGVLGSIGSAISLELARRNEASRKAEIQYVKNAANMFNWMHNS